jgi:hypothetical protein
MVERLSKSVARAPNKRIQRARIVDKLVLRLGHRRVADAQR